MWGKGDKVFHDLMTSAYFSFSVANDITIKSFSDAYKAMIGTIVGWLRDLSEEMNIMY
jgi:hypothetical protein